MRKKKSRNKTKLYKLKEYKSKMRKKLHKKLVVAGLAYSHDFNDYY